MKRFRVTLTFGLIDFSTAEYGETEQVAIDAAMRYARALGYDDAPTKINAWRIA